MSDETLYAGGLVDNEDELTASLLMNFSVENGQVFKILSRLYRIKTHYTDPKLMQLNGKKPASIAYMGENSEAVRRGLKVKEDFWYLVDLNGEKVAQLFPSGFVYSVNDEVKKLKQVKKNAEKDKRYWSWELVKTEPKTKNDYPVYTAKPKEEIANPISTLEVETYTKMLVETMAGYADRLRTKYNEYMAIPYSTIAEGVDTYQDDVYEQPVMDQKVNIEDIPF